MGSVADTDPSNAGRRIPEATVARLPLYYRALLETAERQVATISSERLAELASERRSRYIAVVTSARPLEGDQADRLRSALSSAFGRDMDLQVDVDPSLLGGLVVRVGDELVDGTVVRRLSELRRRLAH